MIGIRGVQRRELLRVGLLRLIRELGGWKRTPLQRRVMVVVAHLFLLMGVVTIAGAVVLHLQESATASWPSTTGHVAEATVEVRIKRGTGGSGHRRSRRTYVTHVGYEYAVDGRTYRGDRVGFDGPGYRQREQAARVVARYPAGAPVTVYYDPERPQRAMLEVGASWERTGTALLVGLGTVGGGSLFLRLGRARPGHAGVRGVGPARTPPVSAAG